MTTTKKKTRRASRRKCRNCDSDYEGTNSMERTMAQTTNMVGNIAIAGMTIGLAGAVLGSIK